MKKMMIFILMTVVLLVGCTSKEVEKSIYDQYIEVKVQYVGNNVEVGELLSLLGANELGEYTLELLTEEEPYGIRLHYSSVSEKFTEENIKAEGFKLATLAIALIENASYVEIVTEDNHVIITQENANKLLKEGDVKDFSITAENLKELIEKLNTVDGML